MPALLSALRRPQRPVRFVVLSQPRSGSSLLCSSLRRHPQIWMYREILNHRYPGDGLPAGDGVARFRMAFADTTHDAVGCKLHACQPDPSHAHWESAWDELFADPTFHVIHLERLDTIAQLASWGVAGLTGEWHDQSQLVERPVFRMDPGELAWFRRWSMSAYQARLARLQSHPLIRVTYESLCDQWDETIDRILRFLRVEPLPLAQATQRNETRPLDQVITNYHELVGGH